MEHADAVELIELAAAEPDGLERLMAGDTPESAAVAGHLAGCPPCVAEMARIRRTASVIREVIADAPDPALRERTLAFVREVGRDRSGRAVVPTEIAPTEIAPTEIDTAETAPAEIAPIETAPAEIAAAEIPQTAEPVVPAPPAALPVVPRASRPRWLAAAGLAAALLLALGLGFGVARVTTPPDIEAGHEIEVLQVTAETTLRLEAQADTRTVVLLATPAGAGAQGTLLFSPATGELVMVASGLAQLEPGQEYGCWVEANGERRRIGKMYPGGDLQSWAGMVDGLGELPDDAVFGVSLVPAGGGKGEPRLTGGL